VCCVRCATSVLHLLYHLLAPLHHGEEALLNDRDEHVQDDVDEERDEGVRENLPNDAIPVVDRGGEGRGVKENEVRLGFSNTTTNPEGKLSHNSRKSGRHYH
jgi:hypothetical protein